MIDEENITKFKEEFQKATNREITIMEDKELERKIIASATEIPTYVMTEDDLKGTRLALDKTHLEAFQDYCDQLNGANLVLNAQRKLLEEEFNKNNRLFLDRKEWLEGVIDNQRQMFKLMAETEFKKTGKKKLIGGLGIRVGTELMYPESSAFKWAKEHDLCLELNTKEFEKIAKTQDIEFVQKIEKVTVTFPAKIIIEGEEQ